MYKFAQDRTCDVCPAFRLNKAAVQLYMCRNAAMAYTTRAFPEVRVFEMLEPIHEDGTSVDFVNLSNAFHRVCRCYMLAGELQHHKFPHPRASPHHACHGLFVGELFRVQVFISYKCKQHMQPACTVTMDMATDGHGYPHIAHMIVAR